MHRSNKLKATGGSMPICETVETGRGTLLHAIGKKTQAAYRHDELFEKRRMVMDAWTAFADSKPMCEQQNQYYLHS